MSDALPAALPDALPDAIACAVADHAAQADPYAADFERLHQAMAGKLDAVFKAQRRGEPGAYRQVPLPLTWGEALRETREKRRFTLVVPASLALARVFQQALELWHFPPGSPEAEQLGCYFFLWREHGWFVTSVPRAAKKQALRCAAHFHLLAEDQLVGVQLQRRDDPSQGYRETFPVCGPPNVYTLRENAASRMLQEAKTGGLLALFEAELIQRLQRGTLQPGATIRYSEARLIPAPLADFFARAGVSHQAGESLDQTLGRAQAALDLQETAALAAPAALLAA
jgi:hypothetical protein